MAKTSKKSETVDAPKQELRSFSYPTIGESGTVIRAKTRKEADEKAAQLARDIGEKPEYEEPNS